MESDDNFLLEEYKNAWKECRQSGDQRMKYLTYYTFFVTLTFTILYYMIFKIEILYLGTLVMTIIFLEIFLVIFGNNFRNLMLKIYKNFIEYLNTANIIRYYYGKYHLISKTLLLPDEYKKFKPNSASFYSIKLICLLNSFLWIAPLYLLLIRMIFPHIRMFGFIILLLLFLILYDWQIKESESQLIENDIKMIERYLKKVEEINNEKVEKLKQREN